MSPPSAVDLIMPAKGKAQLTQECIRSLFEHVPPGAFKLHLRVEADDAELRPHFDAWGKEGVCIHVGPRPTGFANAINSVLPEHGSWSQVFGLVNNDLLFDSDWLTPMLGHFDDPDVAIVGCKLLYAADAEVPNSTGEKVARFKKGVIQHAGCYLSPSYVANHIGRGEHRSRYAYCRPINAVTFALVLLRTDTYRAKLPTPDGPMSALDEAFAWCGVEDMDYCLRILANGQKTVYCADAEVYHYESASRGQLDTPAKAMQFRRNIERCLKRWGPLIDAHLHEV